LPLDNDKSMSELEQERLTKDETAIMIVDRAVGLICIAKGILLPSGRIQPVSQGIFRVRDGKAYVLNKYTRTEFVFGFADWEQDRDGQEFLTVRIPIGARW